MKLEITERDEKLLTFLGLFLVAVVMGWFLIRPLCGRISATRAALQELESRITEKEEQASLYTAAQQQLGQAERTCEELARNFHPMLSSDEIDELVTGRAAGSQIRVDSLEIHMPDEAYTSTPYVASGRYRDMAAQGAESGGQDKDSGEKGGAVSGTQTPGVFVAEVQVTVSGPGDRLREFLNGWADSDPAVRVVAFSLQSGGTGEAETETMQAELAVYMASLPEPDGKEAE